jgi:hypothetical protein
MALTGALCLHLFTVTGVTNKSLRALTAVPQAGSAGQPGG